jgi:hypothetical protein
MLEKNELKFKVPKISYHRPNYNVVMDSRNESAI